MKLTKKWVAERLPVRPKGANKGIFGTCLVVAGSDNFPGAAYLASSAVYRVGAGLVMLATTKVVREIVGKKLPEVTYILLPSQISLAGIDTCLIGPGLGQSKQTRKLVEDLLNHDLPPTVFDADGLNILSKTEQWWKRLKKINVLTPHPGEMERLTGLLIEKIQADRENIARKFAIKWGQVAVLKGANTVIASPTGEVAISPFANPVLATAGTGDVLAGVITGLLAQGLEPFDAAAVGVFIHSMAGEMLRKKIGNAGALASELLPLLPKAIKNLV